MTNIPGILRSFGITRCYKGFYHACFSIKLAVEDDSRLEAVTKEIYMETASYFGCHWSAVERNIRTAVARAWQVNPDLLIKIAGYPLTFAPTAAEFIEIIANFIINSPPPQS